MLPVIESDRLHLVSMSLAFLKSMVAGESAAAHASADFLVPENCLLPEKAWFKKRVEMIEADPEQHAWLCRAIVRKSDNTMVGYIHFHHKAPDPDLLTYSELAAELGYTIQPQFRRNGYARESAIAMMSWSHREHGVRTFVLSISPSNVTSLRMAESMNFNKVRERMDEIDGLEFCFRAEIEDILRTG